MKTRERGRREHRDEDDASCQHGPPPPTRLSGASAPNLRGQYRQRILIACRLHGRMRHATVEIARRGACWRAKRRRRVQEQHPARPDGARDLRQIEILDAFGLVS